MREVVIIGGGISGLAALTELDRAGIRCTLIEVKDRVGGSLRSEVVGGFCIDHGVMFTTDRLDAPFISALNLQDAAYVPRHDADDSYLAFRGGMQTLIDRLSESLSRHSVMFRMAVSSIGRMDTRRFAICMENGMVLDTSAILVATPARYAERIFYTLRPEMSFRLLDYRYDSIARVSLGYHRADLPDLPADPPADYPLTYLHVTDHPERVPPDHCLIQLGVRYERQKGLPIDLVGEIAALMDWPPDPVFDHISVWPESDPIMWLDEAHAKNIEILSHLLPDGIAIANSDYVTARPTLQNRIESGQQAAQRILKHLNHQRN
jgi:protoporphyrinogen oxidase